MHRLPSASVLHRFRLAAILLLLNYLLAPVSLGLLAWSIVMHERTLTLVACGMLALAIVFAIIQFLTASRARCPLCLTPSLANKACSRHRNARKLLGSYRLRVAGTIVFQGKFRCPYCGEPTAMEVRQRRNLQS